METYQWVLTTVSVVLAVKLLLIPSYTSTDFEVHRNWMAITSNLKLSRWYYDVTSEWTLDYPPFFAYFELILSKVADKIGLGDILMLQKEPLMNERVLYFQRISVIVCDMFYMGAAAFLCFKSSKIWFSQPKRVVPRAQLALFVLLTTNAGLILVDNVHFQYNGLLTALLLLSLFFVENGSLLKAALVYSTLLNFKHIYVYYAPAFVIFYLHQYFNDYRNIAGFLSKGLSLFFALLTPIIVSFGPFLAAGGIEGAQQILSRLFPVSRGLTHAYWAPNFWAFYNFADMVLNRVTMIILKQKTKPASGYSSGLVQEHSHALLPSITTLISLACVVSSLAPLCLLFLKKKRQPFSLYLTLSALSFFYFGYHVHEKALLLVSIPLTVLSFHNPVFVPVSVLFSTTTSFSLFPLLFTLFEVPIKYGLAVTYFFLMVFCYRYTFKTRISFILPTKTILFGTGLILVEVYATFIHKAIFAEKLAFFPLMLISVYNTIGVTGCYIWIVKLALEDEYLLILKKKKCELTEEMIKASAYPVQSVDSLEEVKMVAGVDISTSKINSQFAVVSLTIFSFPELEHLTSHEEIVLITEPYITDYLALREAGPIADVVRRFFDQNSQYRPDVLICDGNGRFHSRGCGVACQIGAKAGVASVGVAKNLNLSLLKAVGATKDDLRKADELVDYVSRQKEDGFVPFDVIEPVTMNIARLGGSKVPVYVSAGYGLELDLATEIVIKCARNRICEPIRMADLRSREKVRELFD